MKSDKTTALDHFNSLLYILREDKPNDRSDRDRYWAIVITEVEKARAVFLTYAQDSGVVELKGPEDGFPGSQE